MILSLIIPVYGVEKYIEKCLLSCIQQVNCNVDDYEIIVVNDSTPDRSIEIAERIKNEYPQYNIKIVTRPNGGLSAARNTGVEHAVGEYLWFIDSDDFIDSDSIQTLIAAVSRGSKPQIISFAHRTIFPDHVAEGTLPPHLINTLTRGIDFVKATNFYSAWSRIYSSKLLNDNHLKFAEGILWEDGEFNLRLMPMVDRHYCLQACLYNYLRREGSISNSPQNIIRTLDSNLSRFKSIYDWILGLNLDAGDRKILNTRLTEIVMLATAELSEIPSRLRPYYYEKYRNLRPLYRPIVTKGFDRRVNIIGRALLCSPMLMSRLLACLYRRVIRRCKTK